MNVRSASATSGGGAGNGAARASKASASASSTLDPEVFSIRLVTTLPFRSTVKARLTTPSAELTCAGYLL